MSQENSKNATSWSENTKESIELTIDVDVKLNTASLIENKENEGDKDDESTSKPIITHSEPLKM